MQVPAKIPRIAVYLPPDIKVELEKLAEKERRSLSQMALILIERGIEAEKKQKKKP